MSGWPKDSESMFAGTSMATRCYESHPVLKIGKGKLYGGNGRSPVKKNADIYVVLQSGDVMGRQSDPWDKQATIEIPFFIRDMEVPTDVPRFKKLVTWLCNQLQQGKSVHVGCIGGHGRTGTVLSAIVAEALGKQDAIQYVRKHYCSKAVESYTQIAFLKKHYGVSDATPGKVRVERSGNGESRPVGSLGFIKGQGGFAGVTVTKAVPVAKVTSRKGGQEEAKATKSFVPMASARSLWKTSKKNSI